MNGCRLPKSNRNSRGIWRQAENIKTIVSTTTIESPGLHCIKQGTDMLGLSIGIILPAKYGSKTFLDLGIVLMRPEHSRGIANLDTLTRPFVQ